MIIPNAHKVGLGLIKKGLLTVFAEFECVVFRLAGDLRNSVHRHIPDIVLEGVEVFLETVSR